MTDVLTLKIMDIAAKERVYEGLSPVTVNEGDDIGVGEKGNDHSNRVVTVFGVKVVDGFHWWYATEKKAREPDDPCDEEFMEDIST